ncbi:hypothetical protein KI387_032015, partial [Taxus chinensis]
SIFFNSWKMVYYNQNQAPVGPPPAQAVLPCAVAVCWMHAFELGHPFARLLYLLNEIIEFEDVS